MPAKKPEVKYIMGGTMYHPQFAETYYNLGSQYVGTILPGQPGEFKIPNTIDIRAKRLKGAGWKRIKLIPFPEPMSREQAIKYLNEQGIVAVDPDYHVPYPSSLPNRMLWTDPRNIKNPENRIKIR